MRIVRNNPQLELTEREYKILDDAYTLIAAIDSNLTDEDWNCVEDAFPVSLEDAKDVIGVLMDWSECDIYRHLR